MNGTLVTCSGVALNTSLFRTCCMQLERNSLVLRSSSGGPGGPSRKWSDLGLVLGSHLILEIDEYNVMTDIASINVFFSHKIRHDAS